jgi:hypothetical protein
VENEKDMDAVEETTDGIQEEMNDSIAQIETDIESDGEDAFDTLYDEEEIVDEADGDASLEADGDTDEESEDAEADEDEPDREPEKKEKTLEDSVRAALKALGYDAEDIEKGLIKLGADATGLSEQEYAAKLADQIAWDKQMKADIEAIHKAYPETKKFKSLSELPNKAEFAKAMDSGFGFSAVEAFERTHPDYATKKSTGKKSQGLEGTKEHLTSSVPKGAKDVSVNISKVEMASLRETFGDKLSDAEIKALYKKVSK